MRSINHFFKKIKTKNLWLSVSVYKSTSRVTVANAEKDSQVLELYFFPKSWAHVYEQLFSVIIEVRKILNLRFWWWVQIISRLSLKSVISLSQNWHSLQMGRFKYPLNLETSRMIGLSQNQLHFFIYKKTFLALPTLMFSTEI